MKISKAQETTLRTIADNGGEMDGYAGQNAFHTNSLRPLVREGLLESLGTTYVDGDDAKGFATYNRHKITDAGREYLGMKPVEMQESASEELYTITIPKRLHESLMEWGSFTSNVPIEVECLTALKAAVWRKRGRGGQCVVTARRKALQEMMWYIRELSGVINDGPRTASEFAVSIETMERVGTQTMKPVIRKPVYHVRTGALVGWLTDGAFIDA